jgi:hypothetical protein
VVAKGPADHGTVVSGPFWELLPGRYEATVNYVLDDRTPGVAVGQVIAEVPKGLATILESSPLSSKQESSQRTVIVTRSEEVAIWVRCTGSGTLEVKNAAFAKVSQWAREVCHLPWPNSFPQTTDLRRWSSLRSTRSRTWSEAGEDTYKNA